MKDKTFQSLAYLKHLAKAKNAHGIHSPFVFELYNNVIADKKSIAEAEPIEVCREKLLKKNSWIDVNDLGSGKKRSALRRLKDITLYSVSNKKKSRLLYRLVKYFAPETIIELGTSFGIATMYLALAAPKAKVFTIEGCSQTLSIAQQNFDDLKFTNIYAINATFQTALTQILPETGKADFVYFDGNHLKEPTLDYFNKALAYAHNDTVFIFDDIHQSYEMDAAWESIIKNDKVSCSINLFQLGIVFFRKEMSKQHFVLKY